MKLIKATTEKDIQLEGVSVTLQQVDGKVEAIVITDVNGKYIRIVKEGAYSETLKVLIEEPKEYTIVYDVKVKQSDGGVVSYTFNTKAEADNKVLYCEEGDFKITERQVEVVKDLSGKLVSDADDDSIPF